MWVPEDSDPLLPGIGPFVLLRQGLTEVEVAGPVGAPVEADEAPSLEDSVKNGGGEVLIVEDASHERRAWFVVKIIGRRRR